MLINLSKPPIRFNFSKTGKPLKEHDPNIIITWGKFTPPAIKWLTELRSILEAHKNSVFNIDGSFFGPELLSTLNFSKLSAFTLYCPKLLTSTWSIDVNSQNIGIKPVRAFFQTPEQYASETLITLASMYHTWPNEKGNFKMYVHKSSIVARFKYNQSSPKTYLNRAVLDTAKNWDVLEQYIQSCKKCSLPPVRKDICDLVKTVSLYEAEQQQNLEYNRVLGEK